MRNPVDVFLNGIRGKLLTPAERYLYYFIWKAFFTIIASLVTLLMQIFVFHQAYGSLSLWLVAVFWVVLLVLDAVKKYNTIFHIHNVIIDALVSQIIEFLRSQGVPVPPDIETQVSHYVRGIPAAQTVKLTQSIPTTEQTEE